ncbi:MAG TPA: diguanylate cyclase [Dehalococcoidia bacterium]|nr:diguanylate cyclase [Dehalococcoidia bacterium]
MKRMRPWWLVDRLVTPEGRREIAFAPALEPDMLTADLVRRSRRSLVRPAPLPVRRSTWLCFVVAAAVVLGAALLAAHPLAGIGGVAAWYLVVLAIVVLTARWREAGAVAGLLLGLVACTFVEGVVNGGTRLAQAETRNALLLDALIWAGVALALGIMSRRMNREIEAAVGRVEPTDDWATAERLLRESEARFRALVQHASDIMAILDADGTRRYTSPSVTRVLGLEPDELDGTNFLALVHPEDTAFVLDCLLGVLERPGIGAPFTFRCRHHDGSWRHLEAIANNLLHDRHVEGIVVNARDITERKQAELELAHRAFHDPLTGLPNRSLLLDRLDQALAQLPRRGAGLALLFIDLDGFKDVNDLCGHAGGDALLREVARRLQESVRPGDTVARFGGDEFTVLAADLSTAEEAMRLAARIVERLAQPYERSGSVSAIGASVGVVHTRDAATLAGQLLDRADRALYAAKAGGKRQAVLFQEEPAGQPQIAAPADAPPAPAA